MLGNSRNATLATSTVAANAKPTAATTDTSGTGRVVVGHNTASMHQGQSSDNNGDVSATIDVMRNNNISSTGSSSTAQDSPLGAVSAANTTAVVGGLTHQHQRHVGNVGRPTTRRRLPASASGHSTLAFSLPPSHPDSQFAADTIANSYVAALPSNCQQQFKTRSSALQASAGVDAARPRTLDVLLEKDITARAAAAQYAKEALRLRSSLTLLHQSQSQPSTNLTTSSSTAFRMPPNASSTGNTDTSSSAASAFSPAKDAASASLAAYGLTASIDNPYVYGSTEVCPQSAQETASIDVSTADPLQQASSMVRSANLASRTRAQAKAIGVPMINTTLESAVPRTGASGIISPESSSQQATNECLAMIPDSSQPTSTVSQTPESTSLATSIASLSLPTPIDQALPDIATSQSASTDANPVKAKHNFVRPELSYMELIVEAIEGSSSGMMSLQEIYEFIKARYPYYAHTQGTWQNSIRHNLSVQRLFEKVPRPPMQPGKGGMWKIDKSVLFKRLTTRQAHIVDGSLSDTVSSNSADSDTDMTCTRPSSATSLKSADRGLRSNIQTRSQPPRPAKRACIDYSEESPLSSFAAPKPSASANAPYATRSHSGHGGQRSTSSSMAGFQSTLAYSSSMPSSSFSSGLLATRQGTLRSAEHATPLYPGSYGQSSQSIPSAGAYASSQGQSNQTSMVSAYHPYLMSTADAASVAVAASMNMHDMQHLYGTNSTSPLLPSSSSYAMSDNYHSQEYCQSRGPTSMASGISPMAHQMPFGKHQQAVSHMKHDVESRHQPMQMRVAENGSCEAYDRHIRDRSHLAYQASQPRPSFNPCKRQRSYRSMLDSNSDDEDDHAAFIFNSNQSPVPHNDNPYITSSFSDAHGRQCSMGYGDNPYSGRNASHCSRSRGNTSTLLGLTTLESPPSSLAMHQHSSHAYSYPDTFQYSNVHALFSGSSSNSSPNSHATVADLGDPAMVICEPALCNSEPLLLESGLDASGTMPLLSSTRQDDSMSDVLPLELQSPFAKALPLSPDLSIAHEWASIPVSSGCGSGVTAVAAALAAATAAATASVASRSSFSTPMIATHPSLMPPAMTGMMQTPHSTSATTSSSPPMPLTTTTSPMCASTAALSSSCTQYASMASTAYGNQTNPTPFTMETSGHGVSCNPYMAYADQQNQMSPYMTYASSRSHTSGEYLLPFSHLYNPRIHEQTLLQATASQANDADTLSKTILRPSAQQPSQPLQYSRSTPVVSNASFALNMRSKSATPVYLSSTSCSLPLPQDHETDLDAILSL